MRRWVRHLAAAALLAASALPQQYRIETVAGGGVGIGDGGSAIAAKLAQPAGLAIDAAGTIYVADEFNHRVRRIDATGTISTFAGGAAHGPVVDGVPATATPLLEPTDVAVGPDGSVYIAEPDRNVVRRVDPDGIVSTFAGTGERGFSGDGSVAAAAQLHHPEGVAADATGNVYIADTRNRRVRMVDSKGVIRTVAGARAPLNYPRRLAVSPGGDVYIADDTRISKLDRSGALAAFGGTDQTGSGALVIGRHHVAVDAAGSVYYQTPHSSGIRKVSANGAMTTVLEIADDHNRFRLGGLAADASGSIYFTDYIRERLYRVDASGAVAAVAGLGTGRFTGDGGPATQARLDHPMAVALDALGNVYFPDGAFVRRVDAFGTIVTIAGTEPDFEDGLDARPVFEWITGLALDPDGNVFVAERGVSRVRKVDPTGSVSTVAGGEDAGFSGDGGPASSARLAYPEGLATDSAGNLYVTDSLNHRIRKITSAGVIETVAGSGSSLDDGDSRGGYGGDGGPATAASLARPLDVAVDGLGNIFIADTSNRRLRRVDLAGRMSTVAGTGESGSGGDGVPAVEASLNGPTGVAVDGDGNVFVAESSGHRVRVIDADGVIRSIAGVGPPPGEGPFREVGDGGPAKLAQLYFPHGLAVGRDGSVFVADTFNRRIRKLTPVPALRPAVDTAANVASRASGAAPEAILTLAGSDLAADTVGVRSGDLPLALRGTLVAVVGSDGVSRRAPLKLVSPGTITFLVPAAVPPGAATVSVAVPGAASQPLPIEIATVAPGLFSANLDGAGVAAAELLRVDPGGSESRKALYACDPETAACRAVPRSLGEAGDTDYLILCGTGIRRAGAVTATVGGRAVAVRRFGPDAEIAGIDLVEAGPLPRELAGGGEVAVSVAADGVTSNVVTVVFE